MKKAFKTISGCIQPWGKLGAMGALAALLQSQAFAATGSWTGNSNGNWNVNGNWTAAFPNTAGETATFNNAGNGNTTISMNGATIAVGSIIFDTASAAGYTFNAGGGSLTLNNAITVNSTVGAVTQTFNNVVNLSSTSTLAVTNNSTSASINLAGGVNNASAVARVVTFGGSGNGGTLNGLTQSGGGALSFTFNNSAGIWDVTGTNSVTGALIISGAGGTRVSSDLSGTSSTTISGLAQINNSLSNGGLSAITQSGTIQAFGADRTINTGTHTLNASTFSGSQSLTIGSVTTMGGASGAITNNIASGKALTFNNAGNFSLSDSATNRIRTITGTGNTVITSNIINGGTSTASGITKTGTGTLELSGNNSYAGLTTVSGGVLRLNSANALGASGGTTNLLINSGGVVGLGNNDFTRGLGTGVTQVRFSGGGGGFAAYGADRNVNIGGASASISWNQTSFITSGDALVLGASDATHKVTFQNGLNLVNLNQTVQVNNGSGAVDGEISGVISSTIAANGSLTKTGSGTLNLSAANTYTGLTTVSAGTLLINGSLAGGATVSSGATLGGSGTITGAVNVVSGATVAPGNSPGILSTGNFTLAGTFAAEINGATVGTGYDQINVTGSVDITGSALTLALGYTPADFTNFFLIRNDSSDAITGLINGYTQGQYFSLGGQNWLISYTGDFGSNSFTGGNDLVLQSVPEPSTYMMVSGGLLALWALRRRRRS